MMVRTRNAVVAIGLIASLCLTGCSHTAPHSDPSQTPDASAVSSGQATPSEQTPVALAMNIEEIREGNYSSLAGTWSAENAGTLRITPEKIDWEYLNEPFASIEDNAYTPLRDPESIYDGGVSDEWYTGSNELGMQWVATPSTMPVGSALAFFPAGEPATEPISGTVIPSDENQDRILGLPGLAVGRLMPTTFDSFIMTRQNATTDSGSLDLHATTAPLDAAVGGGEPCLAPVDGAYECAGRAIPADAQPLTTVGDMNNATLVSPSGNIGCDVGPDSMVCLVKGWPTSMKEDYDDRLGGRVSIYIPSFGPAGLGQKTDVPNYTGANPGTPAGQEVPYGTVWYHGDFVIASAFNGLTIWNASTGFGAFINIDGYEPFGPTH